MLYAVYAVSNNNNNNNLLCSNEIFPGDVIDKHQTCCGINIRPAAV